MTRCNFVCVLALACVLAACGGDDSGSKENSETGRAGSDSRAEQEYACGSETCTLPAELEGETLCCMDPFSGGCGVKADGDCRPIPKVDERCPPPNIMVNIPGAVVPKVFGCCTSANECGTDFGMGCQPRTVACMVVRPDQLDQIQHQTCSGEPLPLPANCGMGGLSSPGAAGSGG